MWCYRPCKQMLSCEWALSFCSYYSGSTSMTIVKQQNKISKRMQHKLPIMFIPAQYKLQDQCVAESYVGNLCSCACQLAPSAPCSAGSGQCPVNFACTASTLVSLCCLLWSVFATQSVLYNTITVCVLYSSRPSPEQYRNNRYRYATSPLWSKWETCHNRLSRQDYAILSHRWRDSEILIEDIGSRTYKRKKDGHRKLQFCAEQAAQDKLHYFLINTCCIDRWNLHERSRSINSMFLWYKNATRCYVFLLDVSELTATETPHCSQWEVSFWASAWFGRGWTLCWPGKPVSMHSLLSPH
jgi:hypothetical protein